MDMPCVVGLLPAAWYSRSLLQTRKQTPALCCLSRSLQPGTPGPYYRLENRHLSCVVCLVPCSMVFPVPITDWKTDTCLMWLLVSSLHIVNLT